MWVEGLPLCILSLPSLSLRVPIFIIFIFIFFFFFAPLSLPPSL
jgi:hypothetical protein